MNSSPLATVRACLQAYVQKDRSGIERLLADDFHFTSPIDNALDRRTYMEICWPGSEMMSRVEEVCGAEDGDRAFIVYEAHTSMGKHFRNSEVHTVRNGKIVSTEVYFGWELPHKVAPGTHTGNL
jgi:ketosteroid isomerase-like protein